MTLSAATGNSFVSGSTVYIAPLAGRSGGFTAAATSTDLDSGIAKVSFPALSGFSGGGGDDLTSPFSTTYSWSGAVGASGPQTVAATNNAGLTAAATFTGTAEARRHDPSRILACRIGA